MAECIYQGSFNPVHNAHIQIAEHAREIFGFEKIVFIPAFKPPHKDLKDCGPHNAMHRLEMLQLALEDKPYFDVSAIEYMRSGLSYTYETVSRIYDIVKPDEKINFIIGTDAFIQIESWYKTEKLKDLLDFILFVRENNFDEAPFKKLKNKGYDYKLMTLPFNDISSQKIRYRCAEGLSIEGLVPDKVLRYIQDNGLYKIRH